MFDGVVGIEVLFSCFLVVFLLLANDLFLNPIQLPMDGLFEITIFTVFIFGQLATNNILFLFLNLLQLPLLHHIQQITKFLHFLQISLLVLFKRTILFEKMSHLLL